LPPIPKPVPYAELLKRAEESTLTHTVSDDIRVKIVQALRKRLLIKPLAAPTSVPKPPVPGQLPQRPGQAAEAAKYKGFA